METDWDKFIELLVVFSCDVIFTVVSEEISVCIFSRSKRKRTLSSLENVEASSGTLSSPYKPYVFPIFYFLL